MKIYFGIDGTDNLDMTSLDTKPGNTVSITSYVKRICAMGFDRYKYVGGTTMALSGWDTCKLANQAVDWVASHREGAGGSNLQVYLGGFSRGGAAAIYAAHRLAEKGISVERLFLFDAVDRTFSIPNRKSKLISENVVKACHAIRRGDTMSRHEFGNCGLEGTKGNLLGIEFYTSHGGMGGWKLGDQLLTEKRTYHEKGSPFVSSVTPIQQLSGSLAVWNWMEKRVMESL